LQPLPIESGAGAPSFDNYNEYYNHKKLLDEGNESEMAMGIYSREDAVLDGTNHKVYDSESNEQNSTSGMYNSNNQEDKETTSANQTSDEESETPVKTKSKKRKRKTSSSDANDDATDGGDGDASSDKKKRKGLYMCNICHQEKKGYACSKIACSGSEDCKAPWKHTPHGRRARWQSGRMTPSGSANSSPAKKAKKSSATKSPSSPVSSLSSSSGAVSPHLSSPKKEEESLNSTGNTTDSNASSLEINSALDCQMTNMGVWPSTFYSSFGQFSTFGQFVIPNNIGLSENGRFFSDASVENPVDLSSANYSVEEALSYYHL